MQSLMQSSAWMCFFFLFFYLYVKYSPVNGIGLQQSHRAPAEPSARHPAAEHPVHLHGRSHQLVQLPAAHLVQVPVRGATSRPSQSASVTLGTCVTRPRLRAYLRELWLSTMSLPNSL